MTNKNTIIIENFDVPYYSSWCGEPEPKRQTKFANNVKTILDNLNISYEVEQISYCFDDEDEVITGFENINFSKKKSKPILECFRLEDNLKLNCSEKFLFIEVRNFTDYKTRGVRIKSCQDITAKKLDNYKNKLANLIEKRNEMKNIKYRSKEKVEYIIKELKNNFGIDNFKFLNTPSLDNGAVIRIKENKRWIYLKIVENKIIIHNVSKTLFNAFYTLDQYSKELKKDVAFFEYVNKNFIPFIEKLLNKGENNE